MMIPMTTSCQDFGQPACCARAEGADDQGADHCATDGAHTALQAGAADDPGGNHVEFIAHCAGRLADASRRGRRPPVAGMKKLLVLGEQVQCGEVGIGVNRVRILAASGGFLEFADCKSKIEFV